MIPEPQSPDFNSERARLAWSQAALLGLGLALTMRVALGLIMAAAWTVVRSNLPASQLRGLPIYGELAMPTSAIGQALLGVWVRWDAVQHLNLAMRGYFDMGEGATVFFPLYAGMTRAVAALTGEFLVAGLLVSTLSAAVAFMMLRLIGEHCFGAESGKWAAISLAAYPTAVFLLAPYTESLYLALTLGAFLAAYRMRWMGAAGLAALASLTRAPGMAAPVAFAVLGWRQFTSRDVTGRSPSILGVLVAVAAPLIALGGFLAWRTSAGFAPLQTVLQTYVNTTVVDPFTGLFLAARQWIAIHDLPTTLDILSAVAFLSVTLLMAIRPRWRRPELLAYMVVTLFALLARRTDGAASLKSLSRYVLVLFPAFLIVGDWLASAGRAARLVYVSVSSALLLVLSCLYAFWWFIG